MKYMVALVEENTGIMFPKKPEVKTGSIVMCDTDVEAKNAVAMFGSDAVVYEVNKVGFCISIDLGP